MMCGRSILNDEWPSILDGASKEDTELYNKQITNVNIQATIQIVQLDPNDQYQK